MAAHPIADIWTRMAIQLDLSLEKFTFKAWVCRHQTGSYINTSTLPLSSSFLIINLADPQQITGLGDNDFHHALGFKIPSLFACSSPIFSFNP